MLKNIDKINGTLVQKITSGDPETVIYQTIPEAELGNCKAARRFNTLTEARQSLGVMPVAPQRKPKKGRK